MWESQVQPLGQEDPLEKGMATHSSILAWRIPMDRGAWWAYSAWGRKESDTTEQLSTLEGRNGREMAYLLESPADREVHLRGHEQILK